MKLSLIALVAGCAVASSAFAMMDTPSTNPPHVAMMDTPSTNPPHQI
jgi:xanthosine utilization system XapX-like protein